MPPANFQPRILTPEEVKKAKDCLKYMYTLIRNFDQTAKNLLKDYELGDFMALHHLISSCSRDQRAYIDKLDVTLNLKYPNPISEQGVCEGELEELANQPDASF